MTHIIVDLDGTLALDHARAKDHLNKSCDDHSQICPKCKGKGIYHEWDQYFARCAEDEVNKAVSKLVYILYQRFHITIITGRCSSVRAQTEDWLKSYEIPWSNLLMRPEGDRTDDNILKPRMAEMMGLNPENTLFVLEDRNRVVRAWRALGYKCFQVAEGDF